MKKFLFALCLILMSLPVMAETCADCHSDIMEQAVMHSPAAEGDCLTCHAADDEYAAKHMEAPDEFKNFESPVGEGENLCYMCHEEKTQRANVHSPAADGDCTVCHNPHGGDLPNMMAGETEAETCFMCHENDKTVKAYVHGPLAVGQCSFCHDPHSTDFESNLKMPKHDLCLSCHTEIADLIQNKYKHDPVLEDCTICHDPHNSDYDQFLTQDIKSICFDCHSDLGARIETAKEVHAPVASDGCSACHSVHGSENPFILYDYFPETFYNDYEEGLYKLCFECHDEKNISSAVTEDDTNFRNGKDNLHYRHVKMDRKGRSCKSCHEVHASNQPLHIRKSVPFGKGGWNLPIKFTKNENGGTCVVGCHKPKTYDRVNKVDYSK